MPSLVVDDKQTEFFYLDSGPPQRELYTTVVVVHGHTFHSGIFQRLLPLASSKELRLICLNRRDYGGTTLYNPYELKVLAEGNETEQAAFLEARGIEVALFLSRIIDKHSLPPPTADGSDGGLALMGWSLGCIEVLATLAAVSSHSANVRERVQLYLRRIILHEPPSFSLGIADPPQQYNPLLDETIPQEQLGPTFAQWVSSYFAHGDLCTRDLNNLTYKSPDPARKASIANMTPAEFVSMTDISPATRSESFLLTQFAATLWQQTSKALFDPTTRAAWPRLDIWLFHGDSSPWNAIYPAWEIEKKAKASGQRVNYNVIKGANHFVVWDQPEKAIEIFARCLRN